MVVLSNGHSTRHSTRTLRQISLLTLRNVYMTVMAIPLETAQELFARCSAYLQEYLHDGLGPKA
jgi:hypothetical protein